MWIPGFGDWKRQTWHSIWFKAARLTSFFAMLDCILFIARKSRITRRVLQRFESMVEYVSCFIWDHITPRATGCIVFGCMEGKTKNPTSNNSDKRWETGAQFLFCCLAFCCLMFLEFSQWHVFWKTDITRIFQICMCTAVEWSAICLPWVSPSAYGASQLLGFGNRFVENWKVMGGIGKTQQPQPQWFRTFMSIAICLQYR